MSNITWTDKITGDSVTATDMAMVKSAVNSKLDNLSINNQTGTSYTLVAADAHGLIRMNNASNSTLTVPLNSSVAFPNGTIIYLNQQGAGYTNIIGSGVTFLSLGSKTQTAGVGAVVKLFKVDTNTWVLSEDLITNYDSDAQALFTAASYTDVAVMSAINTMILAYKSAGIWTKTKALWLMAGGTASFHSYNAKNPAQYQITWSGGITHASTGSISNGSSGYGNLHVQTNLVATPGLLRMGLYCRTNSGSAKRDMGNEQCRLWLENSGFKHKIATSTETGIGSIGDKRGWFIANRTASNAVSVRRNDVSISTDTTTYDTTNYITDDLYIMDNNFGGSPTGYYTDREYAGAVFGDTIDATESTAEFNAWNAFNTALSRNV